MNGKGEQAGGGGMTAEDPRVPVRLCWWCKYFDFSMGSPGYSEMTPGSPGHMGCMKNWWFMDEGDTQADLIRRISSAETCLDYELDESVVKEGERQ